MSDWPKLNKVWTYAGADWQRVLSIPCGLRLVAPGEDVTVNIALGHMLRGGRISFDVFVGLRVKGHWKGWNWGVKATAHNFQIIESDSRGAEWKGRAVGLPIPRTMFTFVSLAFRQRDRMLITDRVQAAQPCRSECVFVMNACGPVCGMMVGNRYQHFYTHEDAELVFEFADWVLVTP